MAGFQKRKDRRSRVLIQFVHNFTKRLAWCYHEGEKVGKGGNRDND